MPTSAAAPLGATPPLRTWQREALEKYAAADPVDFLAAATPGAGKTTFALTLASRLLAARAVDRVIVVVPTDHLRSQWADAARVGGLTLDPTLTNAVGPVRDGMTGYVTTYAQVAAHPRLHRARCTARRSLVVLDEIHHAGDALSWGEAVFEAFAPAKRRLALTGTPFRTNAGERIPFVSYAAVAAGELVSEPDYSYGYREALADGVVRPVVFAAYSGTSRWRDSAGEVLSASLAEAGTRRTEDAAWRTALNPAGRWVPHVVAAADARLADLRAAGAPDAAALMLASDQETARAYAAVVRRVTGHAPVVVTSDDRRSSTKIAAFATSQDPWLVAVRQVSEGVDIPRLHVCVWTTSARTPLFFAQAVGRVLRARRPGETATVFLPAVRPLLALAAEMEEERNHVVRAADAAAAGLELVDPVAERGEPGAGEFTPLEADAEFAHLLAGGRAVTAPVSVEEEEYLGLPGLLSPEQTAALLAARDSRLRRQVEVAEPAAEALGWRDVRELRREVNQLVARLAARGGRRHAEVHVEVRRAVPGPPSASASGEVLAARRDWLLGRLA